MNTLVACDVFDAYYEGRKAPFLRKAEMPGSEAKIAHTEVLVERGIPLPKREAEIVRLRD